ncbi:DNA ligase [Bradyrhizobium sp. LMG 9283]|uniref:ATP-dependent DNA ligase n=1 Tax=Bradyrhizobium sp. LMG 9283 TaxID=592064 RepID=UPI00388E0634
MKHDGYRMLVIRENERVRLLSRNGTDWTKRYPWIVEAALKNRQTHFVIDGEAVILGVDGISDFSALHSRKHEHEVQLYAFDIVAMDRDDLRSPPLHTRKTDLEQLLARQPDRITVAPFERGEIGPGLFRAACRMGLEELVAKHRGDADALLEQVGSVGAQQLAGASPGASLGLWSDLSGRGDSGFLRRFRGSFSRPSVLSGSDEGYTAPAVGAGNCAATK